MIFTSLFYQAVGGRPLGEVLVLGATGFTYMSKGGGGKLSWLQNYNMVSVLSEGCLHDWPELREYSFACYCSGETPRYG